MHPQAHHLNLLAALVRLEQVGVPDEVRDFPTMRDLREALPNMNDREFVATMKNLRRRGKLREVRRIKVPHSCKPVAVYGLYQGDLPKTMPQWQESMALWRDMPIGQRDVVGLST